MAWALREPPLRTASLSALISITIAIGGLSAASPVLWSLPTLLVPNSSSGRVGGIMNFSNQISAIAAPILTGWVVERTGSYMWAFVIPTVYILVGIVAYMTMLRRIEADRCAQGACRNIVFVAGPCSLHAATPDGDPAAICSLPPVCGPP